MTLSSVVALPSMSIRSTKTRGPLVSAKVTSSVWFSGLRVMRGSTARKFRPCFSAMFSIRVIVVSIAVGE